MSETDRWDFPLKDLARRKFQTALTVISLATCVSVTVFLVLFGENLDVELTSAATGGLTVGFSGVFSRFIFIVVLFNSATGFLVAYFLVSVTTSDRLRDIAIMKAVGCLTEVVFNYFATELFVIIFAGCLLGTVGGILMNFASTGFMNLLGFHVSQQPLNPLLVILIFFSFAFIFYLLGMRRIVKASDVEPVKALSPLFVWKTTHRSTLRFPFPFGKSFIAKMASRDLGRRRSITLQSVACLSVVMALTALAVVGGTVADETMQSYVDRAVGRNVMLVAEAEMAEHYESLLHRFLGTGQTEPISYLDGKYSIPSSVISNISAIDGVTRVDPRLVLKTTVHERPHIRMDPDNQDQYVVIGGYRSGEALIVGVHGENLVNDWLVLGDDSWKVYSDRVLVGDSLGSTLFVDPWLQSFKAFGSEFRIAGLCLDPLNNGMVVYVSFDSLSSIVEHPGYNVLLFQIDSAGPSSRSRVLEEVEAVISGSGLTMLDLNGALDRQKAFLNRIWSLLLSLSLFSFVNAILSLMGYLMLSVEGQQRDLGVMRALGAKPKTILKVILFQTLLLVLAGGLVGLPIGMSIVFWFFIPEAVISQKAILTIAGLLSALIGTLCLSSLYPAGKIARTPITKTLS
jgi:ABC-type antimicrobial peptide transport system permease subunit